MAVAGVTGQTLNESEMIEMTLEQLFTEHDKIRAKNKVRR